LARASALDEMRRSGGWLQISTGTLRDLVARGPDAAHLVYERMRALGISKADFDRAAEGIMRDLLRTWAVCGDKGVCEWDLRERPHDLAWTTYCPNSVALESLTKLKVQA
jgi:hypothetical protein